MNSLFLYGHTVRYLRPAQVFWRILRPVRRRLPLWEDSTPPAFDAAALSRVRRFLEMAQECGLGKAEELAALRRQEFTFLRQPAPPGGEIPWTDPRCSRLWRYQLQGFRMIFPLALANLAQGHMGDRDRALSWIEDWMAHCPENTPDAWDPYPIAERIFYWTMAESVFFLRHDGMRRSFRRQALRLAKTLEYDLKANHLLREALALMLAAILLQDRKLGDRAAAVARAEIETQILADGGHYERSPMYHGILLFDMLVVRAAAAESVPWLDEAITRMSDFLAGIMHPDGEIPLFNDAVTGEAPRADALLRLAARSGVSITTAPGCLAFPQTGLYGLGDDKGNRLLVKAGPPGAPDQPGHAHGDPFTFELSCKGKRLLVDSGMHGYADSPWRAYGRSLWAHNTVCINGQEPLECWSVFRVARRYAFLSADWACTEEEACLTLCCRWWQGWTHRRVVCFHRAIGAWRVEDTVEGEGALSMISLVHVHPEGKVSVENDSTLRVERNEAALYLHALGDSRWTEGESAGRQGWYSPEFGLAVPMPVFGITLEGARRLVLAYIMAPPDQAEAARAWADKGWNSIGRP